MNLCEWNTTNFCVFLWIIEQEQDLQRWQLKILITLKIMFCKCYIVFFGHKRDFLKQFDVLVVITVGCDNVCFLVLNEARHYKAKMQSFQLYCQLVGKHLHYSGQKLDKLTNSSGFKTGQILPEDGSAPMSSVLPALQAISFLAVFYMLCAITNPSNERCVWIQRTLLMLKYEHRCSRKSVYPAQMVMD